MIERDDRELKSEYVQFRSTWRLRVRGTSSLGSKSRFLGRSRLRSCWLEMILSAERIGLMIISRTPCAPLDGKRLKRVMVRIRIRIRTKTRTKTFWKKDGRLYRH